VSPRAEVNPKFSDQLIKALIGGENFFLSKGSHVGYQKIRFLRRFQKYKLALVTK
jgi:hypothetical protein